MTGVSENTFESTPTWIYALICIVIITVSLGAESFLSFVKRLLNRNNRNLFYVAFKKLKRELMINGAISLLLTLVQNKLTKICVPPHVLNHMLSCKENYSADLHSETTLCSGNKVPLLSVENLHDIHTFIFVFVAAHIIMSLLNVVVAIARIRHLEDACIKVKYDIYDRVLGIRLADKQEQLFLHVLKTNDKHFLIMGRYLGQSFCQQFYSVTRSDYMALKFCFFTSHCKSRPGFDFRAYMNLVLEDYFKQGIDISLYLWASVVIFLALDIHGWHVHFWISFIPVIILLATGAILKHIITQIAHKVVERHAYVKRYMDLLRFLDKDNAIDLHKKFFLDKERLLGLEKSYYHWWFWPRTFLSLIHYALFLSTLEIAYVFWILVTNEFDTCLKGQLPSIVSRLIIGGSVIVVGSYSTLPLYAAVSQMGNDYKKEIFKELSEDSTWDENDPGFDEGDHED